MATQTMIAADENIFAALGFSAEQAESLRIRAALMDKIRQIIHAGRLTQTKAAGLFHVTQPRISDLVRGKIDKFSIDHLVTMLSRAGIQVSLAEVASHGNVRVAWNETEAVEPAHSAAFSLTQFLFATPAQLTDGEQNAYATLASSSTYALAA